MAKRPVKFLDLWTIRLDGQLVKPSDCNPHHKDEGFMVFRSQAAAEASARYHREYYDDMEATEAVSLQEALIDDEFHQWQ